MTWQNWIYIAIFILLAFFFLQIIVYAARVFFKLDRTEREEVLQQQIDSLTLEVEKQNIQIIKDKEELEKVRRQADIFAERYEEVVKKMAKLQELYDALKLSNDMLKEQLSRSLLKDDAAASPSLRDLSSPNVLLVVVGSEGSNLSLDMASAYAVQEETGLKVETLSEASPDNLVRFLDRARTKGNHIYMHMAVKANEKGYQIGDQLVDAIWLASNLNGVIVLLVAGSDSDYVGEFLGVVPYVITMTGNVSNREAAIFSRIFWTEIGRGMGPNLALKRALDQSSNRVRQSIVSYWKI